MNTAKIFCLLTNNIDKSTNVQTIDSAFPLADIVKIIGLNNQKQIKELDIFEFDIFSIKYAAMMSKVQNITFPNALNQ
ncbi:hypothetical protein O9G_000556 [Rozella allomycis CSF55]|uniref:Uncharacterized protein n=1 Tax=Rozella allomycis (strain CSF55) TaxID=988480 RepID=A0A075B084_ROZAC|nr:hypothetical protein O9G_000556 [Rozella allomycis CSF55]|eukprot:EPZ34369.1 hypothetical protein O9G_000556 [Rozella allomycis CSF55]